MLRINRIELENFGPFKGKQAIELPEDDGVTIIYGANMRGKTSLLNAIRYALFGKILTRGSRPLALHKVGNWEAAAEGSYGFKVVLDFQTDGHSYRLTRSCRPRNGVTVPQADSDYTQEKTLAVDRSVLGPEQSEHELARIMPEQVSRFFLFDGELLQEYEELLRDESEMGHRIAEAIERILGLPVLANGRTDMLSLKRAAQKTESRIAQEDLETTQQGILLENLTDQRDYHQAEIVRQAGEIESLKETQANLENYLRRFERSGALLAERDVLLTEIGELRGTHDQKRQELKELMGGIWLQMLANAVQDRRVELNTRLDELETEQRRQLVEQTINRKKDQAADEGTCPICGQEVAAKIAEGLKDEACEPQADLAALEDEVFSLQQELALLGDLTPTGAGAVAAESMDNLDDLSVRIADKEDRVRDIQDLIGDLDQSEFREQKATYEKVLGSIGVLKGGVESEEAKLEDLEIRIARAERKLEQAGIADLNAARRRASVYSELQELFNAAVEVYRDKLRMRVEEDSSSLFRSLTTEPDYKGLSINEQYGLTITHKDGDAIPVRSAGAEHIVALSLIGALQRNAPLRGPIIMDSPFGRLDEGHTPRVVTALPTMADQTVLLVYRRELPPEVAREDLGGKLRAEFYMERQSARHTKLKQGSEIPS